MKHKHLTLDERYKIQNMLDVKESFSSIAKLLGRDRSTISKEVRNHLAFKQSGGYGRPFNDCKKRTFCERHPCTKGCSGCKGKPCHICLGYCSEYEKEICKRHISKPYVCNGCTKRPSCSLEKRVYSARTANQEYKLTLRETRQGVTITEEEALSLDKFISPLILTLTDTCHCFSGGIIISSLFPGGTREMLELIMAFFIMLTCTSILIPSSLGIYTRDP